MWYRLTTLTNTEGLYMSHQVRQLESNIKHYQNVLEEIKLQITEYLLNEQKPPSSLLKQEQAAIRMVHLKEQRLAYIEEILNH